MISEYKDFSRQILKAACLIFSGLIFSSAHADAPTAPANVWADIFSPRTTEIFWNRSSDDVVVAGYELTLDGRVLGIYDSLSYVLRGLKGQQTYNFTVTALDNEGNRSPTKTIRIVAGVGSELIPTEQTASTTPAVARPTGFYHLVYSNSAVEVFWDRVINPMLSYMVYVDGNLRETTNGISRFIDGLQFGREYKIEVVAVDSQQRRSAAVSTIIPAERNRSFNTQAPVSAPPTNVPLPVAPAVPSRSQDIKPDRSVYQENGYGSVNVIDVFLRTATTPGNCNIVDESGCTLADVLADTDKNDALTVDIPVHFSATDFADDGTVSNAELRQRGGGSRFAPQKSFRIKLDKFDDRENLWRTERYLQLNKHPFESDRMRNKLAMDLMSRVPHLPSFRTQFVNLWIDDGRGFEDYGLFTHVERANGSYLKSRGLDNKGNLYKASNFRFDKADLNDVQVDANGVPLNIDRFESSLEIEDGKDHRALVRMLKAIHDPGRSFQSVLDQHFNKNNVMAWMAVNMLLKQNDASWHNYILYNPKNSDTFYFLPWDYDATMARWELPEGNSYTQEDLRERLLYGYALGAENVFVEKFYSLPGIHQELLDTVRSLRQSYLDDATITELSNRYAKLIAPFQNRAPDAINNPLYNPSPSFDQNISWNERAIFNDFSVPLPPAMKAPKRNGENWNISWLAAYDPTGNDISYDLQIATKSTFTADAIVVEMNNIDDDRSGTITQGVDAALLPAGDYYFRVIARSSAEPERFWTPVRNRLGSGINRRYGMIKYTLN